MRTGAEEDEKQPPVGVRDGLSGKCFSKCGPSRAPLTGGLRATCHKGGARGEPRSAEGDGQADRRTLRGPGWTGRRAHVVSRTPREDARAPVPSLSAPPSRHVTPRPLSRSPALPPRWRRALCLPSRRGALPLPVPSRRLPHSSPSPPLARQSRLELASARPTTLLRALPLAGASRTRPEGGRRPLVGRASRVPG